MSKEQKRLGQRIKEYRLERGWTQKRMAQYLGISRPLVIRLERGQGNVMDLTKAKIERVLESAPQAQAVA